MTIDAETIARRYIEAWNETDKPRVVLFVDFEKPLRFPVNLINRALLKLAVLTPYLREGDDNLRRWERQFHSEKQRVGI